MNEIALHEISKKISSGITPLRSNSDFWENGTISWLKTEQLGERYIFDTSEKITQAALENTSIKINPVNTLSIAMYGEGRTRGNISILKSEMTTNQACCNLVIDKAKAEYEFVYYYLKSQYHQLRSLSSGVRKNLNSGDIKNFKIRLPQSLRTQKKIASVLSSLDAKIELNNRINTELEAMAKLLYDYWFVQFDFPDADGKPYKSSGGKMVYNEVLKREIPEGWGDGVASDLFKFNPSLSLSKGSVSSYIDMNALPTTGFMTKSVQKKEFNGGIKFQNGDVVVARITPCLENGKTGLITLLNEDEIGFGSTEFIVLRGKKTTLSSFAACLSRSALFRKYAIANMLGTSGRKRVDAKALEIFSLAIPEESVLTKFEEITRSFFQISTINTKENQQLAELRDWLLPMLMNGQVRVGE